MYAKIEEAVEAENIKETYYWYGRFANLFLIFDPIEETDDINFDDDEFDNFMAVNPKRLSNSGVMIGAKADSPKKTL